MTFKNVVIGEIKTCEQHPNADRLKVCTVDVGETEPLQIVCGAPNCRAGLKVAVALVGAELPPTPDHSEVFKIKKGKLRGVESFGMLCSTDELGLPDDGFEGIMELTTNLPNGTDLSILTSLPETIEFDGPEPQAKFMGDDGLVTDGRA